jgi:hypothetical protein
MRLRRWISWIAVAAILLHTATIARHNLILLQAASAEIATAASAAGLICHTDASSGDNAQTQGLPGPDKGNPSKPCPICLGLASAYALTASDAPVLPVPQAVFQKVAPPRETGHGAGTSFLLPHTRAPPSLA